MTFYLQLAVAGIAVGSVYALIAIGVVLIYKCSGVVNFAQGAFVMLGAYFTFALTRLGLAPVAAVIGAMLAMALVGMLTERLILRPMMKAPIVAIMAVTLGILILTRAVCLAIWGPDQIAFPKLFPDGAINIFDVFITYNYLAAALLWLSVPAIFDYALAPLFVTAASRREENLCQQKSTSTIRRNLGLPWGSTPMSRA
jgi:branched-chain amino acid transport system permease protein